MKLAEEKCNIGLAPVTLALTSTQAELANAVRSVYPLRKMYRVLATWVHIPVK